MTLREEILKESSENNRNYTFDRFHFKTIKNAYIANNDNPFGKGINWVMEELFGLNWKENCK